MNAAEQYTENRIRANGLHLHYNDWGGADRPHLLLTHGAVANATFWDLVAPAFRDDYHVVAVTARGRGKSDYAPDGSYEHSDYVQDFREFTAALDMEKLVYVGQSLGGVIGMPYAATYPEQVERLILVDIGGEAPAPSIGNPVTERPEVFDSPADIETWLRRFDRFERLGNEAMRIVLESGFHQLPNGQWASTMALALQRPAVKAPDDRPPWNAWDILPRIQCPTLLIHGTLSDVLSDDIATRTRDAIPDCAMVEIEAGHLAHLENPGEFVRVVRDFLE